MADIQRQLEEMEEELHKLTQMQHQVELNLSAAKDDIDEKSIYVGEVDYECTGEELKAVFSCCGTVNRVTIQVDKYTGHPKGFAYVEFTDKESVENALKLDNTIHKGRHLKIKPKRQNIPVFQRGRGRGGIRGGPRGGFRGRGGARGGRFFPRGGRPFRGGRGGRGGYGYSRGGYPY